jgi:hypothetical protein
LVATYSASDDASVGLHEVKTYRLFFGHLHQNILAASDNVDLGTIFLQSLDYHQANACVMESVDDTISKEQSRTSRATSDNSNQTIDIEKIRRGEGMLVGESHIATKAMCVTACDGVQQAVLRHSILF